MDYLSSPLGCAQRKPSDVASSWGALCLVEDERLQKHAISGGSATFSYTQIQNIKEFKPPLSFEAIYICNRGLLRFM